MTGAFGTFSPINPGTPSFSARSSDSTPTLITTLVGESTVTLTLTSAAAPSSLHGSYSYELQKIAIIGAIIGPILFLLLLMLGVVFLRRVRKNRGHALSPFPVATPSGRQAVRLSPHGSNPPGKRRRRVTALQPRSDDNSFEQPVSGSTAEREGDQIPSGEAIQAHARASCAVNNETSAEILRLSAQIQQLITQRASVRHPDSHRELDVPPACVEDATEDVLRET
ncbi:hypothetical protein EV421DRAFT_2040699 [Armillaria borealis]|uniref:Mid2 domain-containing protein n=1 Tax=Armillaria borealis TaxID=47425 RepID=A0AA39MG43_9AGAR|nr:hypothetical protein EV421DRAFT_2040699 [Armillaria borealis]